MPFSFLSNDFFGSAPCVFGFHVIGTADLSIYVLI